MRSRLGKVFEFLFKVDKSERIKLLFLTASFFFVVGSYTIIRELKDAVFLSVVGEDYLPWAKIASMLILIPAILFYSFLVDKLRRYQLLIFYNFLYGSVGLIFVYFLGNSSIGIANTDTSPYRIFGWLFYFFVEGYSPFVVSVFWAFANSITSPEAAKKNYALMVSGSKVGGMLAAAFSWYLFSCSVNSSFHMSAVAKHQVLLTISSLFLLFVPVLILLLMKKVPGKYLHGYEAVYQIEKEKEREQEQEPMHLFSGIGYILKRPYVLGIFSMIFFYELLNVVLGYQRLLLAKSSTTDISGLSCVLFQQFFMIHLFGFIFSLLGTNTLLRKFGERKCLMLLPAIAGGLLLLFMLNTNLNIVVIVFIGLRTLNYSLNYPLRESLYIPTIKEIKFKSKSWIDAFGTKFAKGFGSGFNIIAKGVLGSFGLSMFMLMQSAFFGVIIFLWFISSYLLGKRYQRAITHNEVIK